MLNKIKIWLLIWYYKNTKGYTKVSTKCLYAQAWHETGNFTSPVYLENNNLFGMREPKKRETLATGSNKNHAVFKNHRHSIIDYFKRQQNFNIANQSDQKYMVDTVNSNYAEDKNYLEKWRNVMNTIKAPVSNTMIYGFLFFFVAILAYKKYKSYKSKPKKYVKKSFKTA